MVEIEISAKPPSVNQMYTNVPGRGRILTSRYRTWKQAAQWDCVKAGKVAGPFMAQITVDRSMRHKNADVDNLIKPLMDLLQSQNIIENDKLCEDLRIRWGDAGGSIIIRLEEWKDD